MSKADRGRSLVGLAKQTKEARTADEFIDGSKKRGRKKDPDAKRDNWIKRYIYLHPDLYKQAQYSLVDESCDLSDLVDRALRAYIKRSS